MDPATLNSWMKEPGTFLAGKYKGDVVSWFAPSKFPGSTIQALTYSDANDVLRVKYDKTGNLVESPPAMTQDEVLQRIGAELQNCHLVIVRVFNPNSVAGKSDWEKRKAEIDGNHYVLVYGYSGGKYQIHDPGRGLKTLDEYGNGGRVHQFIVYGRK